MCQSPLLHHIDENCTREEKKNYLPKCIKSVSYKIESTKPKHTHAGADAAERKTEGFCFLVLFFDFSPSSAEFGIPAGATRGSRVDGGGGTQWEK